MVIRILITTIITEGRQLSTRCDIHYEGRGAACLMDPINASHFQNTLFQFT